MSPPRVRRRVLLALVLVGLAYASVIQSFSANQTSHFDLIQALGQGTAQIDAYLPGPRHAGHYDTIDKACFPSHPGDVNCQRGHWYSARAPGLALLTLPWYGALTAVNADSLAVTMAAQKGDDEIIWMVGLWGDVLPALLLLILVWRVTERFEPGFGGAAALAVGLGTLMLPLSTLLFSHVLGAMLAFAAFAVLMRERDGPERTGLLLGAGLLVGVALTVEYPTLFVGTVLGLYAMSRRSGSAWSWAQALRRGVVYAFGIGIGVIPLAIYNQLAFGSITHVAYHDIQHNQTGFFGIRAPDLSAAYALLFDSRGLLTLAPVLVMAAFGLVAMYRRGHRAEVAVIAGTFLVYLIYNSGYFLPFGGGVPGPRFLTTTLPFLAVAIAAALRRHPGPTIALAGASVLCFVTATLTHPLVGFETETVEWMRLVRTHFFQPSIVTALGFGRGWVDPLPFLLLAGAAIALVATVTPRLALTPRALLWGLLAVGAWALLAAFAPYALGIDHAGLQKIVEAGDPTPFHPPSFRAHSNHPLASLAPAGAIAGAAALLIARLSSLGRGRGRGPTRPPAAVSPP